MDHGSDETKEYSAPSFNQANPKANEGRTTPHTKNITRIDPTDPMDAASAISQMVWPATHKENRPGTVILGIHGNWATNLATVTLIHHPNNGPLLYGEANRIPETTLNEIRRLDPIGSPALQGTQVILVGDFSEKARSTLEKEGWKVDVVTADNPAAMASTLDTYYSEATEEVPQSVIVGSLDSPETTLPSASWIAHMPEPLLYVNKNGIPEETVEALEKREGKANIYLLGPESIVSKDVETQLEEYGNVTRIEGDNPETNAIAFAKFKDEQTGFGWGITELGHGLTFVRASQPDEAIAAAAFAHLGKHAPMLLLEDAKVSKPLRQYLLDLQLSFDDDPTVGPYNHAFIIGSEKEIPFSSQGILDQLLEIVPREGNGNGGHGGHGDH